MLLEGEAGGGKTSLVREFCSGLDRVLWGSCDPLFTPRPLGPLLEIAQQAGGELAALAESGGKPYQLAAALVRAAGERPGTVIVLEDLHWADAATLDVLSLLGRRIGTVPALVVATYRPGELDRGHQLRRLLGELRGEAIRRLSLEPLSVAAVTALAAGHGRDGAALHRATGGNPFFVTEVLCQDGDEVPPTVRDAVLSRTTRLSEAVGAVLQAVAIVPQHAQLWLLDAMVPDAADGLDEALRSGILCEVPGGVAFRHELARITVEGELTPYRLRELHRRALAALTAPPSGERDLARLVHHAEAAGDTAAVLEHAPAAAEHAASIGAHREAAAHYARALRAGGDLSGEHRAELLERRSYECYLTDQADESIEALREAIACRRAIGDRLGEASAMSSLSRRLWCGGYSGEALRAGQAAVDLLEALPPGRELALAYSNIAQLQMNDENLTATLEWGNRALAVAEEWDVPVVTVHSLNNIGTMELLAGRPEGRAKLELSLALAERAGLEEHIGRAYIHIGWAMTRTRMHDLAPLVDRGIETCEEMGLEAWKHYLLAYRAQYHLDSGCWAAALADAGEVLRSARSLPLLRILALTVAARVNARLGDGDARVRLDEAARLTAGHTELQYLAPVAVARAEVAWLSGYPEAVEEIVEPMLELARGKDATWLAGELAWLRQLANKKYKSDLPDVRTPYGPQVSEVVTPYGSQVSDVVTPYGSQLQGDYRQAAQEWDKLGCPFDAALALAGSPDEDDLRRSLEALQRLGCRPVATMVAQRLRRRGIRGVPRGPQQRTRNNPAELTSREMEVLGLVREGLSDVEIAQKLFLSRKTVNHHVSAILRKLGVSRRGQAAAEAARRGLTG